MPSDFSPLGRGREGGYTDKSPARNAAVVSPSNTVDLPNAAMFLWNGTLGDIKVDTVGGDTAVVFAAVPAGSILPVQVKRVYATGTTSTNIVACY